MIKKPRIIRLVIILLFVLAASFPLFAADAGSPALGSGEPGLHIIYTSKDRFVIYLDEPDTVGSFFVGGCYERKIQVLSDRNYGLEEKLRTHTWGASEDMPVQLYPFDEQTAFTCEGGRWARDYKTWEYWPRDTHVFSTNADSILLSNDVYALARSRYDLTTNQLFLGKIGTNIFHWETRDPRKVYYRGVVERNATNYLELPKRVKDLFGVTKALHKDKDIGFMGFGKSRGFFHYSPYDFDFIEFSYKETKRVKRNQ